jgi:tetraacyldisaccharide 4'-kinase
MRWLRFLSAPLAPFYAAVVRGRNRAFDGQPGRSVSAGIPVVSIGNLSMGGTGKTPLTLFLAQGLQREGWPNVVLSRGYGGRRTADPMEVRPGSDPSDAGDEAAMMAGRLGPRRVVVARKRIEGAQLVQHWDPPPRCLLLDDGFQHRAIHREIDLLVLDGVRRWGNGKMLPAGDLREPAESARRADALVVTRASRCPRAEVEAWWARHGSGGPVFFTDFKLRSLRPLGGGDRISLPLAESGPVLAFCALGHPEAFFADLLLAGVRWVETVAFRDHHPVSRAELRTLEARAEAAGARVLVCTEKDAVKLRTSTMGMPILVAEQEVESGEPLLRWVLERLQPLTRPESAAPSG